MKDCVADSVGVQFFCDARHTINFRYEHKMKIINKIIAMFANFSN